MSEQQEVPIEARSATGSELLAELSKPPAKEERNEAVMNAARMIGYDEARRLVERSRAKEAALLEVFKDELLPPPARGCLRMAVGMYLGANEDWDGMMAAHAQATGTTVEELMNPTPQPQPVPTPEDHPVHEEDDAHDHDGSRFTGEIPLEHRLGSWVHDMVDDAQMNFMDENTESFTTYTRYKTDPEGGS